ncbi:MAG: prepilin-type N-terminal cleavage/methylation domain-containing protein [Nitrospirae bacterium]|nr:prepilin-type N-terminal cleavage/methylation domain-containing protein [Nitrospirota bacterium]
MRNGFYSSLVTRHSLLSFVTRHSLLVTNKGFTLIELLIVIFIIALTLTFAGVMIQRSSEGLRLNTLAKEISATLRYARSHAIAEKKLYSFIVNEEKKYFALYSEKSEVICKTFPEELQFDLKGKGFKDIKIDFYPQGNSTGGTIELKSPKNSKAWAVSVNRVTGKVEVKRVTSDK